MYDEMLEAADTRNSEKAQPHNYNEFRTNRKSDFLKRQFFVVCKCLGEGETVV